MIAMSMLNIARHKEGEPSWNVNPSFQQAARIVDLKIWRYAVWYTCVRWFARANQLSDDFPTT